MHRYYLDTIIPLDDADHERRSRSRSCMSAEPLKMLLGPIRTAVKHCAACTMAGGSCTLEVNDTSPGEPRSHLQRQCPEKLNNKSCRILVLVRLALSRTPKPVSGTLLSKFIILREQKSLHLQSRDRDVKLLMRSL
ncbi:hypothetical protein U0070_001600 [Myodes glareolus]|uniref:Uncharacterized protein n=1 Tax=Myodes glareolus TaxID=447135 RepID=A0AAW0IW50_MYOGA